MRFALVAHFPGIGSQCPGNDVDKRRLAGAVLAEQRMHLPPAEIEVHRIQRENAWKAAGISRPSPAVHHPCPASLRRMVINDAAQISGRLYHYFAETEYSALKLAGARTRLHVDLIEILLVDN